MKRTLLAVGIALLLVASPLVVTAAEDPRFETYVPEPTLQPGETTQLTVQLQNDAADPDESVDTAYDVKATMVAGDTPFSIKSGVRLLGNMGDGQLASSTFTLSVPRDIEAGTYRIPIELTYRPAGEDERTSTTVYATVRVEDHARFEVVGTSTDAQVGDSGTVTVQLRNVGSANATGATVAIQSSSPAITFGQSTSATRYVGDVGVNETVTVSYRASIADDAEPRPYGLTATVNYDDEDGATEQSAPLRVGVTPVEEQSFSLSNVESTLRVGEEGTVTVSVTNDGPQPARDAVVTIQKQGMNIDRLETEYAIGTLDPGESTTVTFPLEVTTSAEPGPKQFGFTVEYQNRDGDSKESDRLNARVDVAEERDRFSIDPVDATLEAGQSGELVLEITNNGDDPVKNVNAKLFADAPLSTNDDEAYVAELAPGETTEIPFSIASSGSALEKDYPVDLDFQYEVGGTKKLSKTYTVAVSVVEPTESGGIPTPIVLAGVVLVLAIIGYAIYRR